MNFAARAVAYNAYLVENVRAHLGRRILDIGCGIGNTTSLLEADLVVGMDVSDHYLEDFRRRLPGIEVVVDDIAAPAELARLRDYRFDTIFSSNVLEHIEDDEAALASMREILPVAGRLVLLVPNHPSLYGSMDAEDLHFRRYTRADLVAKVARAGFRVDECRCVNFPGIFWWYFAGRILKRARGSSSEAGFIDRVIPLVRLSDRLVGHSAGLSLILVATRQ